MAPGKNVDIKVEYVYGRDQAMKVIEAAMGDYQEAYGQQSAEK
jgi:inorganic pyrophosphatase